MKKNILLLLFTLTTLPIALCQSIDVEKRTRDAIYSNLNTYHDTLCDTQINHTLKRLDLVQIVLVNTKKNL